MATSLMPMPTVGTQSATVPIAGVPTMGTPGVNTTSATNTLQPLPAGSVPVTGGASTTIGAPTTGISSGLNTTDGSYTLTGDFKDTYGAGTGKALAGVLGGLGTATDNAVQATNANIIQQANIQGANISSGLAASGISADSSTNALAQGDFAAQVNSNLASTDAKMELGEENTLISALQSEGNAHGGDSSTFDNILGGISDVLSLGSSIGGLAGDLSQATGASGTTASILDGLAAFA